MASTLDDHASQVGPPNGALAAAEAVQRIVDIATRVLSDSGHCESASRSAIERVAHLRDELHVAANRVARFGVEAEPRIDPLWVRAPIAASAVLGPAQLLHQLELSAARLKALLGALGPEQWAQQGRMGVRRVSLGEVVDAVVQRGLDDLFDLLDALDSRAERCP